MPHSIRLSVMEVDSFLQSLTPKRFALLKLARKAPRSIAELASAAKRDPSAVSKDVSRLKAMGLVRVTEIVNAGHGVKKVIEPIANQIEISARLL